MLKKYSLLLVLPLLVSPLAVAKPSLEGISDKLVNFFSGLKFETPSWVKTPEFISNFETPSWVKTPEFVTEYTSQLSEEHVEAAKLGGKVLGGVAILATVYGVYRFFKKDKSVN